MNFLQKILLSISSVIDIFTGNYSAHNATSSIATTTILKAPVVQEIGTSTIQSSPTTTTSKGKAISPIQIKKVLPVKQKEEEFSCDQACQSLVKDTFCEKVRNKVSELAITGSVLMAQQNESVKIDPSKAYSPDQIRMIRDSAYNDIAPHIQDLRVQINYLKSTHFECF